MATTREKDAELLRLLKKGDGLPNSIEPVLKSGCTSAEGRGEALIFSANKDYPNTRKLLLQYGVTQDAADKALLQIIKTGESLPDAIKPVLQSGCTSAEGRNAALKLAIQKGYPNTSKILAQYGAMVGVMALPAPATQPTPEPKPKVTKPRKNPQTREEPSIIKDKIALPKPVKPYIKRSIEEIRRDISALNGTGGIQSAIESGADIKERARRLRELEAEYEGLVGMPVSTRVISVRQQTPALLPSPL